MALFTELDARSSTLRGLLGKHVTAEELSKCVEQLSDEAVCELVEHAAAASQIFQRISLVASGIISNRSARESGHSGLAQSRGHRSPVAFIQQATGVSRSEAMRQMRVGEALVDSERATDGQGLADGGETDSSQIGAAFGLGSESLTRALLPNGQLWHTSLRTRLMEGALSTAQFDAVKQGLGDPPSVAAAEAWAAAAEHLAEEAHQVTVEELGKQARSIRDMLDPEGAEERFAKRYEARSFRMWRDASGFTHGKFLFDDDSAAWVSAALDSALRPRRGGPRFVDPHEKAAADELRDDPRTNDQLAHDLLTDLLKSGAVADAKTVFGAGQPGLRIVQVVDREQYLAAQQAKSGSRVSGQQNNSVNAADQAPPLIHATHEIASVTQFADEPVTIPASFAARSTCNAGRSTLIVDTSGNPLDVGREQRLFTTRQRVALAARDGGCRWRGCDRPASYCEAHHIDQWSADGGRTDIDRGILLCRFHHMQLHNNGWKITREGLGPFMLHPPDLRKRPEPPPLTHHDEVPRTEPMPSLEIPTGSTDSHSLSPPAPYKLQAPLASRYAWQLTKPPPKQFRRVA